MEKDKRNKEKRANMRRGKNPKYHKSKASGSSQSKAIRGVIDVADSSDDNISNASSGWVSNNLPDLPKTYSDEEYGADFEYLAQKPITTGNHYQFSSEKSWYEPDDTLEELRKNKFFTLDIDLLAASINTIPFYKQMDLPSSLFTKDHLKVMDEQAENAEKIYKAMLEEHEKKAELEKDKEESDDAISDTEQPEEVDTGNPDANNLNATDSPDKEGKNTPKEANNTSKDTKIEPSATNTKSNDVAANNRDDIQQWLDDILEEE